MPMQSSFLHFVLAGVYLFIAVDKKNDALLQTSRQEVVHRRQRRRHVRGIPNAVVELLTTNIACLSLCLPITRQ